MDILIGDVDSAKGGKENENTMNMIDSTTNKEL